jgi:2-keto-3-deoxy-L-rhamnonate aldolase
LPILSLGCAGTIDGAAGFFPRLVVRLYKLSIKETPGQEEIQERRILQYTINSVEELVVNIGLWGLRRLQVGYCGWETEMVHAYRFVEEFLGDKGWENWKGIIGELERVERSLPLKQAA